MSVAECISVFCGGREQKDRNKKNKVDDASSEGLETSCKTDPTQDCPVPSTTRRLHAVLSLAERVPLLLVQPKEENIDHNRSQE